jgi:transposase
MSYIVKQKVGNITYVLEATSYWDKEKKQSRQKRRVLGKIDPETGEVVLTRGNNINKTVDYGNQYFLEEISKKLKLDKFLKESFGDDVQKILHLAYYLLSENSSLHLFEQWCSGVEINDDLKGISSQSISKFLSKLGVSDDKMFSFFDSWINQNEHKEGVFYDISSISSYSEQIESVERGYNRDNEDLPQINIGMLYSKETELPLRYDITQGSIADVSTLKRIIEGNKELGMKQNITYIMDKGFFSLKNLEEVLKDQRVIIPLPYSTTLSKELLSLSKDIIKDMNNMFLYNDSVYYYNKMKRKLHSKEYSFFVIRDKKKHDYGTTLFYKRILEIENYFKGNKFDDIDLMKEELNIVAKSYAKFFKVSSIDNQFKLERNMKNIEKDLIKFGTTILFTNIENMDHEDITKEYRSKDRVEQMFDSLKNNLDFKRMKVHSNDTMKGKLFIVFIALIIDTHILNVKTKSKDKKINKYTRKEIIKELRKIKKVDFKETFSQITDISKKAKDIFKEFNIDVPESIVKENRGI